MPCDMAAEIGLMYPQTKKAQGLQSTPEAKKKGWIQFSPRA